MAKFEACIIACAIALSATSVKAQPEPVRLAAVAYLEEVLAPLARNSQVINAIRDSNRDTALFTQEDVNVLDREWRSEIGAAERPLIDGIVANALSATLRAWKNGTGGGVLEVFVMNERGLLVAADMPTSDFWQGDEDVHAVAMAEGVYVDEVSFDASTQRYTLESSLAVVDPENGRIVGALGIGLAPRAVLERARR